MTISRLRIDLAAQMSYEGSSHCLGPWKDLPPNRQFVYCKQAIHLIVPKRQRHAAVQSLVSQTIWDRRKEIAA